MHRLQKVSRLRAALSTPLPNKLKRCLKIHQLREIHDDIFSGEHFRRFLGRPEHFTCEDIVSSVGEGPARDGLQCPANACPK